MAIKKADYLDKQKELSFVCIMHAICK